MVDTFKTKILKFFAHDYFEHLQRKERDVDREINMRVAQTILKMDPFEPILKEFHGVFSERFEKVEENLSTRDQIQMAMWAWGQGKDPFMDRMIKWVMDTAGNEMIKSPARTNEDRAQILMWGKAQIANMVLFRKEIGRLSVLYEEILKERNGKEFDDGGLLVD